MARTPATASHGWIAGVDLLVECRGTCAPLMRDKLLGGVEHLRAVVKLTTYAPNDPPVCPNCGGPLVVLARQSMPGDKQPSKKKGKRGKVGKRGKRGGFNGRR